MENPFGVPLTAEDLEAAAARREDLQRRRDAPEQKQSTRKTQRKARDTKAMKMRMDGATLPEIMEECGFKNTYAVRTALERATNKEFDETSTALRIVEDANLEEASRFVMDVIRAKRPLPGIEDLEELLMSADRRDVERSVERMIESAKNDADLRLRAVDRYIKIGERKGKIWGYDAPTKQEISGDSGIINVVFDSGVTASAGMSEPELVIEPES